MRMRNEGFWERGDVMAKGLCFMPWFVLVLVVVLVSVGKVCCLLVGSPSVCMV